MEVGEEDLVGGEDIPTMCFHAVLTFCGDVILIFLYLGWRFCTTHCTHGLVSKRKFFQPILKTHLEQTESLHKTLAFDIYLHIVMSFQLKWIL